MIFTSTGIIRERLHSTRFFAFDSLNNYFQCGDSYARCVFLNNLPASLLMENFSKIIDVEFPLLTSIHTESISKDKALKLIKQQLNSMEKIYRKTRNEH